ncbi:MAG: APC family permease [Flavobacteriaceae bacterium]|jgi:amino acid transporter|nr:APC family permease [Flavobacteriaceae bacterium]
MEHLERKLEFWSCLAVGIGLVVASGTLVNLGQGMGIAGAGFVIAMVCAWILQHFSAQTYSELACMIPAAGGIRSYTRVAMGALPAVVATISGFLIPNILAGPAELSIAGSIISENFAPSIHPMIWGVGILFILTLLNIIGVDIFAKSQIVFTIIMVTALVCLGLIGLFEMGKTPPALPETSFNPLGWKVLGLTALAIWLYMGIEFVAPLAQETINPDKNIPKAMTVGLIIIFIVNLLYGFASLKYVSKEELAISNAPHILVAQAILGKYGAIIIAIVSIFASASTLNTVIGVVPRMLYGMGINGELPRFFGAIHKRFKTPFLGIIFVFALITLFYTGGIGSAGNIVVYIMAACCSWLVCYIIAHINVIILRIRYPEAKRPYRTPLYPLPQIAGSAGMLYCIFNIAPEPSMAPAIYTITGVLVGVTVIFAFIWLKFVVKEPLFKPMSLEEIKKEWTYEDEEITEPIDDGITGNLSRFPAV